MIIDTDNYHAIGKVFQFPGGEWHANVRAIPTDIPIAFHAKLRNWDDVGKLLAVADAYMTQGHDLSLFAPYFPGMRQDRNPNGLTPLTVRVYAAVLSQYFSHVTVVDPHSHAGVQVLDRYFEGDVHTIYSTEFLADLITPLNRPDVVLIPDKGAAKRSEAVAELFGAFVVQADKVRDFETGVLSGFSIPEQLWGAKRILIPDDICDGGGTFLGLLAEIRKQTSAPVDLFVTHGIFSKGLRILEGFDNIYTTDSFYNPETSNTDIAHTIELLPYYTGEYE